MSVHESDAAPDSTDEKIIQNAQKKFSLQIKLLCGVREPLRAGDDPLPAEGPAVAGDAGASHGVVIMNPLPDGSSRLWTPGQTITISFYGSRLIPSNLGQTKVQTVAMTWLIYANLYFKFVDRDGDIRIAFNRHNSNMSDHGRTSVTIRERSSWSMNLNIREDQLLTPEEKRHILHEFGHALGLYHEHQSPMRELQWTYNRDALIYGNAPADLIGPGHLIPWEGLTPDEQRRMQGVINEVDSQYMDVWRIGTYTRYDPSSIMHYGVMAGDAMDTHGGNVIIYAPGELSHTDKAFITCLYPYVGPDAHRPVSTLEVMQWALDTLGIDRATQRGILPWTEPSRTDDWQENDERAMRIRMSVLKALEDKYRGERREWERRNHAIVSAPGEVQPNDTTGIRKRDRGLGANPAHAAGPSAKREPESGPFLTTLIAKLKEFFNPGGGQVFVLQFPGRFLQESQYAWDTKSAGIYGHFIKPTAVNESEFRLVDQMYDVAEVVSAPNGTNLSIAYEQMLNNLLPKYQDGGLVRQQAKIRAWLLSDAKVSSWMLKIIEAQATVQSVSDSTGSLNTPSNDGAPRASFAIANKAGSSDDDGSSDKVNRLELSNALMQEYLQAKQTWELERDAMIEESLQFKVGTEESARELNNLTRKLAHITAIREAQLASKYADAVVQGFYHNVRQYLGYLDIKSAAEFLQEAKDSFREAAMSSMDGALKVYPVQMSPIDWFEGLSTSFTMEDLTSNPELIANAINAKSLELDTLNGQLAQLTIGTKGNAQDLEKAVTSAQDELDKASSDLAQKYSNNIIAMAKTCIDAYGNVQEDQLDDRMESFDLAEAVLADLSAGLERISGAQTKLTSASRALSDLLARHALAEATDTRQQQEQIKIRIASITRQLQELNARYTSLNTGSKGPKVTATEKESISKVELLPKANNTSGGSRWQEITMYQKITSSKSKSSGGSSAQASQWNVNLWLGSASGGSSSSAGFSTTEAETSEQTIELGFRATLVTVDRGGWFQPQFFKQSKGYYHINDDLKWTEYPSGVNNPEQLKKSKDITTINNGLLPAYPVGYIVCKDITIKIEKSATATATDSQYMSSQAAASGGILCFSYSGSSSESSESKSFGFQSYSDGYVVRIPGPQILGYILQLTEKDNSSPLPDTIPENFFVTEEEYESVTKGGSRGVEPGGGRKSKLFGLIDEILKTMGVSEEGVKSVHKQLKKDLETVGAD